MLSRLVGLVVLSVPRVRYFGTCSGLRRKTGVVSTIRPNKIYQKTEVKKEASSTSSQYRTREI